LEPSSNNAMVLVVLDVIDFILYSWGFIVIF
jgi:hypothetical protein